MRTIAGCVAILLALSVASADDKTEKIDPSKLVGKWEPTIAKDKTKPVFEFMKDGKFSITHAKAEENSSGTYKVDGNKITLGMKFMGNEIKHSMIVTKLTDTEMAMKDEGSDKIETLTRIKDK